VRAEGRARADALRLDVGEPAIDQQTVAGEQQRARRRARRIARVAASSTGGGAARRCAARGRAQKFSTIAL
jgi:hypothetical protein